MYIPVHLAFAGRHPYKTFSTSQDDQEIREKIASTKEYKDQIESVIYTPSNTFTKEEQAVVNQDRGTFLESHTITQLYSHPKLCRAYGLSLKDGRYSEIKISRQVAVIKYFKIGGDPMGYNKECVDGYVISGQIDGMIWNKCIIEIKNRTSKFMEPQYDLDQLITYMILYPIPLPGRLVQQLNGEIKIGKEIPFEYACQVWRDEIKPKIDENIILMQKI